MISDRIKEIRQKCGLSQADFGKRLGVSRDVVSNIENERLKNPGQKESLYRLICATFGVDEHWLRAGDGKPFPPKPVDNLVQFETAHPHMTDVDKALMEAYFSLTDDQKAAFLQYCLSVAETWQAQERKKSAAIARSGDHADVNQVSKEEEDAVLPPKYTGDM